MLTGILIAVGGLAALALACGILLGYADIRFRVDGDPMVEKVDSLLPQTQCGQCGYPGCRPFAEAVTRGEADFMACTPGGVNTAKAIADLLGREMKAANDAVEKPKSVALINEQLCIGCTLCIQACPVDAILGAAKQMHTVIAQECTGCELCIKPCPVDCIDMVPIGVQVNTWRWPYPKRNLGSAA